MNNAIPSERVDYERTSVVVRMYAKEYILTLIDIVAEVLDLSDVQHQFECK